MPNISKVGAVAAASISKINGVAIAAISKFLGVECPAAADDDPIDFATVSEPWGTALAARTEGGTFCQPNGPDGYYTNNFNKRITFEAPSGKRIRFTITLAHLDNTSWQYGITLISPTGAGLGNSLFSSNYFSHQVRNDGEWRVTVEFF